jgi:ubiquinone biosynthesis protein
MAESQGQRTRSREAQRRARYREIAKVVWEERLFEVFRGTGLEEHLPANIADEGRPAVKEADLPLSVRVRHALERLGPVAIKLGQLLSTRGDLLPAVFIEELARLQDNVPVLPWPEMKTQLESELGAPVEKIFRSLDETPIAAGSIGQVYKAVLLNGTPVAVKVQRPGVGETMELDLDIMHELAVGLVRRVQLAKDYDLVTFIEGFAAILRSELDYTKEGLALERFRTGFTDDPSIVFPAVYRNYSTSCVLTMDLMEGVRATERDTDKGKGVDWPRLVRMGVDAYFRMIFQMGFYHADPHPGNLFALPDGRLGFLDCGRVAEVSERNREMAFDMMAAVVDDDPAAATDTIAAMTGNPPNVDLAELRIEMEAILVRYRKEQSRGKGIGAIVQNLLKMLRAHHLRLPGELIVLFTTVGVLEGSATQLDPDYRMIDAVRPFARRYMPERYSPEHIVQDLVRSGRAYGRFFDSLPTNATRALRRMGDGEFNITVRPERYEGLVDRLTAAFYLLAYSILVSGLIIGLTSLVGQRSLSMPEQVIYRVVLYAAIASAIWLLVRTMANEWRRRKADRRRL